MQTEFDRSNRKMCSTSLSWLASLKRSDSEAWADLVTRYSQGVYLQCRKSGLAAEDAQDVIQQVFTSVFRKINDFDRIREASFRNWLSTITRNAICSFFRRQANEVLASGGSSAYRHIANSPDIFGSDMDNSATAILSAQTKAKLKSVLSRFRRKTQQVFLKVVLEGKSVSDVAEELQMSSGAVRQARYAILRQLRLEFGGENAVTSRNDTQALS